MDSASQSTLPVTTKHYRTREERRRIVEETLAPGTSVAVVARAHGVNANQVFAWRKLYRGGLLQDAERASASAAGGRCVRLLPVAVSAEQDARQEQPAVIVSTQPHVIAEAAGPCSPGSIELTLGKVQNRIVGQVDGGTLRMVLECLRR